MNSKKLLLTVLLGAPLMGFAQSVLNADISYAAEASKGNVFNGVEIKIKNDLDLSQLTDMGKPFAGIAAIINPITNLQKEWAARTATFNNQFDNAFDNTGSPEGQREKYIIDLVKDIAEVDMSTVLPQNATKRFSDPELQKIGEIAEKLISKDTQEHLKKLTGKQRLLFLNLFYEDKSELASVAPGWDKDLSASTSQVAIERWQKEITAALTSEAFRKAQTLTASDMEGNVTLRPIYIRLKDCLNLTETSMEKLISSIQYTEPLASAANDLANKCTAALEEVQKKKSSDVIVDDVLAKYTDTLKKALQSSDGADVVVLDIALPEVSDEKTAGAYEGEFITLINETKAKLAGGMPISGLFNGKNAVDELSILCNISKEELTGITDLADKALKTDLSQTKEQIVKSWATQLKGFMKPEIEAFSKSVFGDGAMKPLKLDISSKIKDVVDHLVTLDKAGVLSLCADVVASCTSVEDQAEWLGALLGADYKVVQSSDYTKLSATSSALEAKVTALESDKKNLEKSVQTLKEENDALKTKKAIESDNTAPSLSAKGDSVPHTAMNGPDKNKILEQLSVASSEGDVRTILNTPALRRTYGKMLGITDFKKDQPFSSAQCNTIIENAKKVIADAKTHESENDL